MKKKISMSCQSCGNKNYSLNKSNLARLVIKKFCKKCNLSTMHKEEK
ncbi:50S ribosomal protein L33 [Mesomycoplasma conjunctivae]|nr:50S ribosomal protein L33 [Mesomycoplasma conjunctivae]